MIKSNPLVSIISVNYNATEATIDFLESLASVSYPNLEIIIVDNASDEDPGDVINERFPFVKLIRSKKNLGFAGGNNLGIEASKGDFLFFVNNDTILNDGLIPSLLSVFSLSKNIGGVSPKIKYAGTETLQFAGYTPLSFTARNLAIGNKEVDSDKYSEVKSTPYLHGAAMMISRSVIDAVGKMPDVYFLYYEEIDWCEQIRSHGFELLVDQRNFIQHKASVSVGQNSPLKTYYMMRNRWLFIRRNGHLLQKIFYFFYVSFIVFPKDILKHFAKNEKAQLKAVWRGYFWHYRNIIRK